MLAYVPDLQRAGCEVTSLPLLPDEVLRSHYDGQVRSKLLIVRSYVRRVSQLLRSENFHCLWIEIELLPYVPYLIERQLLRARPYVLDIDDAWFHRYQMSPNPMVRLALGQKLAQLMRGASQVIVGSPFLEDYAREAGASRVTCVPTAVDTASYPLTPAGHNEDIIIGWVGTPSNERYLHIIQDVLADVCRSRKARFRVIGARPVAMPGVPTEFRPWREETEARDICEIDIGVMPLTDGVWERGKCGYKLIQYMAASRVAVASRVGANTSIVRHGVTGFLVDDAEAWRKRLLQLIDDRMGAQARGIAEAEYDLSTMSPLIQKALRHPLGELSYGAVRSQQSYRASEHLLET
jgi:glycosyltransferase involved in cell wall biosynthesis